MPSQRPLKILRLLLAVEETSAPYNQFSLPLMHEQDITVCTYFRSRTPSPPGLKLFEGDGSLVGFLRNLRDALHAESYGIVHVHSPHLGVLFLLGGSFNCPKLLSRTVYTVHSSYANFKLRNRLLLIPVFAAFRRIVCCGEASSQSFPRFFRWLAGERLCWIRNGADLRRVDRIARGRCRQMIEDAFVILAVGRLIKVKDPGMVLDAFNRSDDGRQKLTFVGGGPLRDELAARVKEVGSCERVTLTGEISREDVFRRMSDASLFISASRIEGIPVAVLEAMASYCPVILSDIPAHREIADGADFIPLIPPGDVASLARAIARFRGMSRSERKEIGARCRRLVEKRFDLAQTHRDYRGIYEELQNGSRPSGPREFKQEGNLSGYGEYEDQHCVR